MQCFVECILSVMDVFAISMYQQPLADEEMLAN